MGIASDLLKITGIILYLHMVYPSEHAISATSRGIMKKFRFFQPVGTRLGKREEKKEGLYNI